MHLVMSSSSQLTLCSLARVYQSLKKDKYKQEPDLYPAYKQGNLKN